jgi:hypothetical protein
MRSLSYRIVVVSWCIVMHTLCQRYLLLYGRIIVQIMRGRDVLECDWIVDMYSLSFWNVIVSWCIVMHTLYERFLLLNGRIRLHIMRGRDVQCGWIVEVHILS